MTANESNKVVWLTGNEEIRLVTDLLEHNQFSSRPHPNAEEMLVLQFVYTAYRCPNQWFVFDTSMNPVNFLNKVRKVVMALGDSWARDVVCETVVHDQTIRVMVKNFSPEGKAQRMAGYSQIYNPKQPRNFIV